MAFERLTREQLIEKINKIMALASNNPNEAEAAAAAGKAQALLAEYNLSHADLSKPGAPMSDVSENSGCEMTRCPPHLGLATAVAKLYFCGYFYRDRPFYRRQHVFIGAKHNTDIARSIFEYLCTAIERLAREGARQYPEKERSPYRTEFRIHASLRLQDRLIKRRREAEAGQMKAVEIEEDGNAVETTRNLPALLTTYKQELERADTYMNEKYKIKMKKTNLASGLHAQGAADGRKAGETIGLDPQLNKQNQRRIGM